MRWRTVAAVGVRTAEAWSRQRLGLSARPYKALLELTAECNSRCGSCAIWKTPAWKKRQEAGVDDLLRMLQESGQDLVWLAFSGGEVTLYDDFAKLVQGAVQHCPNLSLMTFTTNGLLPEKALECALAIRDTGCDAFITISLDGDQTTHDQVRGVLGNYELCLKTRELLVAHGVVVHFGITLSDENAEFVEARFAEQAERFRAVTFVHSEGMYGQVNTPNDDVIARSLHTVYRHYRAAGLGELVEKAYLRLGLTFLHAGRARSPVACGVGTTSLHVRPDGSVHHCMFEPSLGNIRETPSLRSIANAPAARAGLRRIERGECAQCWMNCYAPHSMLLHPLQTLRQLLRPLPAPPRPRSSATAPAEKPRPRLLKLQRHAESKA
jgi:MoaA/NifB/PqqE/SkfB family radical SAM enzyme